MSNHNQISSAVQKIDNELGEHAESLERIYEQRNQSLSQKLENIVVNHESIDVNELESTRQLLETSHTTDEINHDELALDILDKIKTRSEETQTKIINSFIETTSPNKIFNEGN